MPKNGSGTKTEPELFKVDSGSKFQLLVQSGATGQSPHPVAGRLSALFGRLRLPFKIPAGRTRFPVRIDKNSLLYCLGNLTK